MGLGSDEIVNLAKSWDSIIGDIVGDSWLTGLMSVWDAAKDVRPLGEGTKCEQGK